MNKSIDLITTGKALEIAEDRGWQFAATHQRLTDLAREGRLRVWGYKGSSAELLLIDQDVWQDHGLDPLNGQLVIPKKIFARDYAEQIWRDVHFDRREIEAAFPHPSGEEKCSDWLMQLMREIPENQPSTKQILADEATRRFGVSRRAFDTMWTVAIKETGANWGLPGRRPGGEKS